MQVATLKFVSYRTNIPVPQVHSWNSDAANPVGAEYMIMEKIHGVPASKVWDALDLHKKRTAVSDVARYLASLFEHRFSSGGSLYIDSHDPLRFEVGPIVSVPFYRALDGEPRVPAEDWASLRDQQAPFRGPFNQVTDFLLSVVRAELNFLELHRSFAIPPGLKHPRGGEAAVAEGEEVLRKALDLYPLFPGNMPVYSPMTSPDKPFSICLDDFRLSNTMINETTGKVTGLFELEGTTIAPTWACGVVPGWLVEENHADWLSGDESGHVRAQLRQTFMDTINEVDPSGEWARAQSVGRPYRYLINVSKYFVPWGYRKEYVDALLEWCKTNPGKIYTGPWIRPSAMISVESTAIRM
ncbi:hypothetical protein FRC07_001757 [Ceratobasidium sp. 392]|nr:hypothetical protein FRC07_001757 [Ceratobasidium sp. 392]